MIAASLVWPQGFGKALNSLDGARTPEATRAAVERLQVDLADDDVAYLADEYLLAPSAEGFRSLRDAVELRALAEPRGGVPGDAAQRARQIKGSGLYADPGLKESSNWFARLIQRLSNLGRPNLPDAPTIEPIAGVGEWLITAVKLFLAGIAALFIFVAARHFRWKKRLKRQASAMLDEDEPERTPDEWLDRAEVLAAEGRFREAVRCLYLACLLRFDEHGVARFQRHETNWEHLRRIEASPKKPASISFREPTRLFDRVWYGSHVRGVEDYEQFRMWYRGVLEALEEKAA